MVNALNPIIRRNLGFAGEGGDILNQQAAQDFRAPEPITNNSIAAMMQPQNYMRIGNRVVDLGPSAQESTFAGRPAYQTPEGGITAYTPSGERVTMSRGELMANFQQGKQAAEFADLNRRMMEAKVAEQEGKAREAGGVAGGKPTFNADAGGYVYPPSAENPQGKFVPVSGFTKPEKPLTEYQGQSVMFGTRAADAHNLLNSLENKVSTAGLKSAQALENIPLVGTAAHAMLTPEQQQVDQAQRNFVNAVLRRESGASISQSEFDNAKRQYFPQAGSSEAEIEQKRRNRELVIQGFSRGAGPGSKDIMEIAKNNPYAQPETKAKGTPKTGEVRNGYMFLGGDPSDPNRWKEQ